MNIILKPLNRELITSIVRNETNRGLNAGLTLDDIEFVSIEEVTLIMESFLTKITGTAIMLTEEERNILEKAYWDLEPSKITLESYITYIRANFTLTSKNRENKTQILHQPQTKAQIQEDRLNKIKDAKTTEDLVDLYKDTVQTMVDLPKKQIIVNGVSLDLEKTSKTIAPVIMARYYKTGQKITEEDIRRILENNSNLLDQLETLSETDEELKIHFKHANRLTARNSTKLVLAIYLNGLLVAQEKSTSNLLIRCDKEYFILDKITLGELIMSGKAPISLGTALIPERNAKIVFDSYNEEAPFKVVVPKNTPII